MNTNIFPSFPCSHVISAWNHLISNQIEKLGRNIKTAPVLPRQDKIYVCHLLNYSIISNLIEGKKVIYLLNSIWFLSKYKNWMYFYKLRSHWNFISLFMFCLFSIFFVHIWRTFICWSKFSVYFLHILLFDVHFCLSRFHKFIYVFCFLFYCIFAECLPETDEKY